MKPLLYKGESTNYLINSEGKVTNLKGRELNHHIRGTGYNYVNLRINKKLKSLRLCRLVAENFLENSNNYPVVNHIDADRLNDSVTNLEWCSYSYNNKDRYKRHDNPNSLKVQLTYKGELLEFKSVTEACKHLGVHHRVITQECKGTSKTVLYNATYL